MTHDEKFWNDWLIEQTNCYNNITYNDDGSINVDGDVDVKHNNLTKIIPKFNIVNGCVDFSNNKLKSLENSPKIRNGFFSCRNNNLNDFKYSPIKVNGGEMSVNGIKNGLSYTGSFYGYCNQLKSFEGLNVDGIKGDIMVINDINLTVTDKQIIKAIQRNDIKWLLLNNKNNKLVGYEAISLFLKGELFYT